QSPPRDRARKRAQGFPVAEELKSEGRNPKQFRIPNPEEASLRPNAIRISDFGFQFECADSSRQRSILAQTGCRARRFWSGVRGSSPAFSVICEVGMAPA